MSSGEVTLSAHSSKAKARDMTAATRNVHPGARFLVEEAARTNDAQHRRLLLHQALDLEIEGDAQYETLQSQRTDFLGHISSEYSVDLDLTEADVGEHLRDTGVPGVLTPIYTEGPMQVAPADANQYPEVANAVTSKHETAPKLRDVRNSDQHLPNKSISPRASENKPNVAVRKPVRISVEVQTPAKRPTEPITPKPLGSVEKSILSPGSSGQSGSPSRRKPRKLEVRSPKPTTSKKKPKKLQIRSRT